MQLLSVKETAKRLHLSERRIQILCETNRLTGARMVSGVWLIPSTVQKPTDERTIQTAEDYVSLSQLCKELSISTATGRNWMKLGKLTPSAKVKNAPVFSKTYVHQIKTDMKNGANPALKSRRNKKYISGTNIYRSYVSDSSVNLPIIQSIVEYVEARSIEVTNGFLCAVLAECALQLILNKQNGICSVNCLSDYINNKSFTNDNLFLVDDILDNEQSIPQIVKSHSELFQLAYTYEEGEDILGLLYISLKNLADRKATGSYYTPAKIVKKLCQQLFAMNETSGKDLLDPCCGTGNFILQLPPCIQANHIYGHDIDSLSIKIARLNYALKYHVTDASTLYTHFTELDYLFIQNKKKYDFIVGNPPWGYEFSIDQKNKLINKYRSAVGGNIESYDIFIERALADLLPNGVLSFILPEAVLNVKTHMPIRQVLLHDSTFQYIEFLGNVFDQVQCPCIILQTTYSKKAFDGIGLTVKEAERIFTIRMQRHFSPECLSFSMTDTEYQILKKIARIDNAVTLLGNAKFALGIVTGDNQKYITKTKTAKNERILKGSDLYKFRFKPSDNYIVFQPESFQQVAPTEFYRAKEKLLYRFVCNQLVFAYDNTQTLSLNSCNIVIPELERLHIKYIMAILNSRPVQFFFKKQFHSVKILRSHIEQIPIPAVAQERQNDIIALVDVMLTDSNIYNIQAIYEQLDHMIALLYGLTEEEYQSIKASMTEENLFLYHELN